MKMQVAKGSDLRGLTRIEVLVVVAVLAVLMVIVLAGLTQAKKKSQRIDCAGNLKQIGLAFRLWAPDSSDWYPMQAPTNRGGTKENLETAPASAHFCVMSNELNTPKVLVCPADKGRVAATNWNELHNANISYFVGLDAEETRPQMFLSGDSNLEMDGKSVGPGILNLSSNTAVGWTAARHTRCGNILLADGSVQQFTTLGLQQALQRSGVATNRLAMP